ncbi:MAG: class I SAM-dependent methyltransferase [Acidobacteria bacterium]|nr:class I SAM-dependent methyltransferase [Acidobacteriota bacterium]
MSSVSTEDVVAMYSQYPYPSPTVGKSLSYDIANLFYFLCGKDDLNYKKVLDAGCGTGQRVLGFAKRYPKAEFQGIDLTQASLEVANQLARSHRIHNITFKQRNILSLDLKEKFNFIVSTGVVHHLADPQRGLENLCRHLTNDGVICLWYYHPLGEFDRLLGRELLLTLWDADRANLSKGQRIMEQLQLRLLPEQYGTTATQKERDRNQLSIDADAFMHPIVNAYRFDEAMAMFKTCEVDWVAVNGINTPQSMKLVDLMQVDEQARELCLWDSDLFEDEGLIDLYRSLSKVNQLRAIELLTKPTGFTVMAGRRDSYQKLARRIEGNMLPKEEVPEPYPRLLRVD